MKIDAFKKIFKPMPKTVYTNVLLNTYEIKSQEQS